MACLWTCFQMSLSALCCFTGTLIVPSLSPRFACGSERRKPGPQVPALSWVLDAQTGHFTPPACSWASFWAVLDPPPLVYPLGPPYSSFQDYIRSVSTNIFFASGGQTKHCLAAGGKEPTIDSEISWGSLTGSSSLATTALLHPARMAQRGKTWAGDDELPSACQTIASCDR